LKVFEKVSLGVVQRLPLLRWGCPLYAVGWRRGCLASIALAQSLIVLKPKS
jgi:hypothetical protein